MTNAALVAKTFGLDPVAVLGERDPYLHAVRLAAHNAYIRETNKANKAAS